MEEKASLKSAMVSRLPKFGARSSTGGTSTLPNGSPQTTSPAQDGKTTPPGTHPNGVVRKSSFTLKWRKDGGSTLTTPTSPEDLACGDKPQTQLPLGRETKNLAPGTPKFRRCGSSLLSISSPKTIPKQASKTQSPKVATKLTQSPHSGGPKVNQNGSSAPTRLGPMSGSESRLVRPKASSSSLLSSSQDSLSQSSDSLKTLPLDNMVRSHSFTHFKQIPSPTSLPMTRSFSFNRAVELAKPLANTQLRPPRTSFLKPPQLSNGRMGLGLGGLGGSLGGLGGGTSGIQYNRTSSASTSLSSISTTTTTPSPTAPTPTTPNTLKKPLLPSCLVTKPSGSVGGSLGYRLARPGQAKQQKPLFSGCVKGDVRPTAAGGCGGKSGNVAETECTSEGNKADLRSDNNNSSAGREAEEDAEGGLLRESSGQIAAETLEDMSLSSASSLERVDTSEEFPDDIESLGDTLSDGDLTNHKTDRANQSSLGSFLNETMDMTNIDIPGRKEHAALQGSQGHLPMFPEGSDLQRSSSLELSPSNSSGGTYMWDEEGLEPLGGPTILPCDSYNDSGLNNMDVLNNLEPVETKELEDDDLMLDVELPEDGLLQHDTDEMSHFERSDRASRQGHWRRKQHRWNGQDHFHNDRAPVSQHYDGLRFQGSFRMPAPCQHHLSGRVEDVNTSVLDELTLKHMAQDCGSLKDQLVKLKTLLQLEDADCASNVEESEDNTTALQLVELMKEVRSLREELSSRDKTIAQLTLQCQQLQQQQQQQQQQGGAPVEGGQGRYPCQQQRAPSAMRPGDRRGQQHYDKATQTHWRAHGQVPQILQPSNPCLNELFRQERQVRTPTEVHSDAASIAAPSAPDVDKLSLLSAHLHLLDRPHSVAPRGDGVVAESGMAADQRAPAERSIPSKCPVASCCPRMLQPPRLHKRIRVPALPPGGAADSSEPRRGNSLRLLPNPRAEQLPPPSRGLPCFDTGPPAQSPGHTLLTKPRAAWGLLKVPGSDPDSGSEEPAPRLRNPGASRRLIPSSHTCLSKPKIHYGAHKT